MKMLLILVLILSVLLLFGCASIVNKNQNTVTDISTGNTASGDAASTDLNINSIDAASNDSSDIALANTQVDETTSAISNW